LYEISRFSNEAEIVAVVKSPNNVSSLHSAACILQRDHHDTYCLRLTELNSHSTHMIITI